MCFVNVIDAGVSKEDIRTPNSHNKAMATPQREEWRKEEAMEIELILNNKVFKSTVLPEVRRAIIVR